MARVTKLSAAAKAMGRKGGKARTKNLTPEQLSAIGRLGGYAKHAKTKIKKSA